MAHPSNRRCRLALMPALFAVALLGAACSTASGGAAQTSPNPAGDSTGPSTVADNTPGGSAPGAIDPCVQLTKADVQPFFSVPVVTQLPGPKQIGHTCEWQANDSPGGVSTSLDINVRTGQDAIDGWSTAVGPTSTATMFSGVGDQAEHYPGAPDFVSIKGQILCGITSVGYLHLAGKMNYQPGSMPDDAATQIAQQYGTLCNKIFGSGNTTPTMIASPAADQSSAPATPAASVTIPATGGTLGANFPLPVGLDCAGVTSTDSEGTITCSATSVANPKSIYPFYLNVLPGSGYTINHESEETAQNGDEVASILFEGNGVGGFSTINVLGPRVTISLRLP